MHPRRSSSTHTEDLGDEASVYDWAHARVHALNPTAAHVWRLCDGATSPDTIAAALQRELGINEAEAVVDLALKEFARLRLLEQPVQSYGDRPAPTRRWLLGRGLAAAMLPAVYTILAPSPLEAQSPGGAPTLTSVSPAQGTQGTTVAVVTLTGTNFVAGATAVNVSGGDVTVTNIVVVGPTSLTATFGLGATATVGARNVTVTTSGGTSNARNFTINPSPGFQTFTYTGGPQTFTVPAGVTSVTVTALGAQGGRGNSLPASSNGGLGGQVIATLTVVPNEVLNIFVGGAGEGKIGTGPVAAGGFNGGGIGGFNTSGGGGGGASDIRSGGSALSNRVIVAGGGGGGTTSAAGGAGGSTTGGAGGNSPPNVTGGGGGTPSAGGAGGADSTNSLLNGQAGSSGTGGAGGPVDPPNATLAGGGGGGGYFGGGGGAGDNSFSSGGGGGGGSSFTGASATSVTHAQGVQTGNGQVAISW